MQASGLPVAGGRVGRLLDRIGRPVVGFGDKLGALSDRLYGVILVIGLAGMLCAVLLYASGLLTGEQLRELWRAIGGS
jgi:hypothetical protein